MSPLSFWIMNVATPTNKSFDETDPKHGTSGPKVRQLGQSVRVGCHPAMAQTSVKRNAERVRDLFGATILLLVGLPILAIGALAVLLRSGRPVFLAHVRIGKGRRPFKCWKLLTMEPDALERLKHDEALRLLHTADTGGATGVLFSPQHLDALIAAVNQLEAYDFDPRTLRQNAERFRTEWFQLEIRYTVEDLLGANLTAVS